MQCGMPHATPIGFGSNSKRLKFLGCKKPSVGGSLVVKPRVPRLLSPASTESSDPIIHLMMVAEDERRSGDLPTAVNSNQAGEAQKLSGIQREATPPSHCLPREATPPSACQEIPTEDVASWSVPLVTWWKSRALSGFGRTRFHSHREEWHLPRLLQRGRQVQQDWANR